MVRFEDYAPPLVRFGDYAFPLVRFEDYAFPLVRFGDYAFPPEGEGAERREAEEGCAPYVAFFVASCSLLCYNRRENQWKRGRIMPKKSSDGRGVESNEKALKFQEFLMENEINVFSTESVEDEYSTVIFRSRIETKGQILPMAVLIDTSIFTIIRTQIITGIPEEKREHIRAYLNELNAQYKVFKYYLRDDGAVYLDICLPFVEETFDSKMIQLMLSVLVQHLDAVYEDIMAQIWGKEPDAGKKI